MILGHPPLFQMSKTQEPKPQSQGISRLQRWSGTTWNLQQRFLRLLCHSMVPALLSDETETTGTLAAKRGSKMPISWGSERGLISLRANKIVGASSVNLGFWAPITCRARYDIFYITPKNNTFSRHQSNKNRIVIMILLLQWHIWKSKEITAVSRAKSGSGHLNTFGAYTAAICWFISAHSNCPLGPVQWCATAGIISWKDFQSPGWQILQHVAVRFCPSCRFLPLCDHSSMVRKVDFGWFWDLEAGRSGHGSSENGVRVDLSEWSMKQNMNWHEPITKPSQSEI